jgi:hypothetical protein
MDIKDFFIPPCFRPGAAEARTLTSCLVGDSGAITYVTKQLFFIVAITAFFYVLFGAFQMITAFGNEGKFTEGRKTVLYALVGMAIATLASLIVGAVVEFLGGVTP